MFYLVNLEDYPVSDDINFPSGVMFMSELWSYSNHRNKVGRIGQSIFVDVIIWGYIESSIHCFLRLVICAVTSWTILKCMFYLVTVEVVFVSADQYLPRGAIFMA